MSIYRAFPLSADGKIYRPPHVLDVTSDAAAIEAARAYLNGHDIEVWHGQRRITTLRHAPPKHGGSDGAA